MTRRIKSALTFNAFYESRTHLVIVRRASSVVIGRSKGKSFEQNETISVVKEMKVLLDTNIIIDRETKDPANKDIGKLFWWIDKLGYKKCIHQVTVNEISRNQDVAAREAFHVKIQSYHHLPTQAPLKPEVLVISEKYDVTENDKNDTILINEVFSGRVDLLITEDRKIHTKAFELGIDAKVFTIDSFFEKVTAENPELLDYKIPSIRKEYFGNIDLEDEFFDTFKEDYVGFDKWFNKKADEIAYTCSSNEKIFAYLYLKIEDESEHYSDVIPPFTRKRRLKIGSFKVQLNGLKLGERFLKIIFDNALHFSVDEIYVTIFPKRVEQIRLINLLADFGFQHHGIKQSSSGKEDVYVRDFSRGASLVSPKITYPFMSTHARKFLVPIYPEYHTNLFPDSILRTESPLDFVENEPFRNAISKVYVSRSLNRDLKTGDIIVFYRTGGYYKSVVTTLGIVEGIRTSIKDRQNFVNLCRKRSVFSDEELTRQWDAASPAYRPFIVNFLYSYSFPKRLNLKRLIELGVIRHVLSVPRGFEEISDDSFDKIIKETGSDETIIVD
jgi:predicted nucleic acid-binding protein